MWVWSKNLLISFVKHILNLMNIADFIFSTIITTSTKTTTAMIHFI